MNIEKKGIRGYNMNIEELANKIAENIDSLGQYNLSLNKMDKTEDKIKDKIKFDEKSISIEIPDSMKLYGTLEDRIEMAIEQMIDDVVTEAVKYASNITTVGLNEKRIIEETVFEKCLDRIFKWAKWTDWGSQFGAWVAKMRKNRAKVWHYMEERHNEFKGFDLEYIGTDDLGNGLWREKRGE